jgi:hypothetical protein
MEADLASAQQELTDRADALQQRREKFEVDQDTRRRELDDRARGITNRESEHLKAELDLAERLAEIDVQRESLHRERGIFERHRSEWEREKTARAKELDSLRRQLDEQQAHLAQAERDLADEHARRAAAAKADETFVEMPSLSAATGVGGDATIEFPTGVRRSEPVAMRSAAGKDIATPADAAIPKPPPGSSAADFASGAGDAIRAASAMSAQAEESAQDADRLYDHMIDRLMRHGRGRRRKRWRTWIAIAVSCGVVIAVAVAAGVWRLLYQ